MPAKRARYDGSNMGISAPTALTPASVHNTSSHQLFQQSYQEHMKNVGNNPSSPTNATPPSPSSLYQGIPAITHDTHSSRPTSEFDVTGPLAIGAKFGLLLPNPAPDVTPMAEPVSTMPINSGVAQKLAMANANGK